MFVESPASAWRNMRSIPKFESWGLFAYYIETWIICIDNSRLKESAISLRVNTCIEWCKYDGSQSLSLILKSSVTIRILFKFTSVSFRYFKVDCYSSE